MKDVGHKIGILTVVLVPLIAVFAAIVLLWNRYVFASDMVLLIIFYVVTQLGITIGFHRMLTHQGFQTYAPIRAFFLILGTMAFDGQPDEWAATHIRHHAHSDEEHDPHSPLEGFWHAHFGWLFSIDNFEDAKEYAPHLLEDPVVKFVSKTEPFWWFVSLFLPYYFGGWTGLVWGGGVRIFLTSHVTWSVNSICHTFGNKAFQTTDESRNNWLIGLLAMGEGWHNNHHAFPRNAFHGMRWWQFDMSGIIINCLEKLGLVWEVQRVTVEAEEAHHSRADRMRDALAELKQKLHDNVEHALEELHKMPKVQSMSEYYEATVKRLHEIREANQQRRMLKKQRMIQYQKEVQELLTQAKEAMRTKMGAA